RLSVTIRSFSSSVQRLRPLSITSNRVAARHVACAALSRALRTPYFSRMPKPSRTADATPDEPFLTGYDMDQLVTYLRLLDADDEGADWREVARIVLNADPAKEPGRAERMWASHLARAQWMTEMGYRHLLRGGPPN